ncbi:uncharacterized protein LOC118181946 [Stegodyphus dumicola]|uniref:uncharacterized protein LOC118181946 n=1 Tax=Stegodyphus dumicola TaxID=202533 RepID=UPI0015ABE0C1|nr:uncharacterized protein LOC118181946 [Stegodyphus dumicola]
MNSFYLTCFIVVLGISMVSCQQECGRKTCKENQCCVQMGRLNICRPYQKLNRLCGLNLLCDCEQGLECVNEGFFSRCKRPTSTTEGTTAETTVSTEETTEVPPEVTSETVSTEEVTTTTEI